MHSRPPWSPTLPRSASIQEGLSRLQVCSPVWECWNAREALFVSGPSSGLRSSPKRQSSKRRVLSCQLRNLPVTTREDDTSARQIKTLAELSEQCSQPYMIRICMYKDRKKSFSLLKTCPRPPQGEICDGVLEMSPTSSQSMPKPKARHCCMDFCGYESDGLTILPRCKAFGSAEVLISQILDGITASVPPRRHDRWDTLNR